MLRNAEFSKLYKQDKYIYVYIYTYIPYIGQGFLTFLCPSESVVKPTEPFSGKCSYRHKTEIVGFIDVNKHFLNLTV
jgi:hypothetical protein